MNVPTPQFESRLVASAEAFSNAVAAELGMTASEVTAYGKIESSASSNGAADGIDMTVLSYSLGASAGGVIIAVSAIVVLKRRNKQRSTRPKPHQVKVLPSDQEAIPAQSDGAASHAAPRSLSPLVSHTTVWRVAVCLL